MTDSMKWDTDAYRQRHNFVFEYGTDVLSLLEPQTGERILDVGCGTGQLTAKIAATGAEVIGIDSSAEMIESARRSYPQIQWVVASATDFGFDESFDAIFSNAALHWVRPPEDAVRCMARALKKGGRFVVEFGGKGNVANVQRAMRKAARTIAGYTAEFERYYPSIGEYSSLLEKHGIQVKTAALIPRPTKLDEGEQGLANWYRQFDIMVLEAIGSETSAKVIEAAED